MTNFLFSPTITGGGGTGEERRERPHQTRLSALHSQSLSVLATHGPHSSYSTQSLHPPGPPRLSSHQTEQPQHLKPGEDEAILPLEARRRIQRGG